MPPDPDRHDAYAALRNPYVRAFAIGRMVATLAAQFVSVAVGWELYERTRDPWMLGLVGLAQVAPAMVLMLPAGNVADRYPRRNVAMIAYVLTALSALGLAAVSWLGLPVELVYGLLALSGVGRAFAGPSTNSLLAQLLTPKEFQNAYAWLLSSGQVASISGPALGGILIALTGAATPSYLIAAVGHVVFILTLLMLPVVKPPPIVGQRSFRDVFAGVAYIRQTPVFLAAITLDLFAVLLGGAVALLPVYARDILMVGPAGLGVLRAAPSVGAMLAALISTRLPPWRRPGRVLLVMVAGFGLATVGFGLSRDMTLSLICLFLTGAFDSISMVIRGTLQQVVTPDRLRGRVSAVNSLFISLSNEMGAFESGAAARLFGPVAAVVGGGVGTILVVAFAIWAWPALWRIGPLHTLAPEESKGEPAAPGPVAARAGAR
jgi:MFS family permease